MPGKNILNLKTNEFRERTKEDYYTKCLQYNYKKKSEVNKEIYKELETILLHIANDTKMTLDGILSYLGYSLTGNTTEQAFLGIIGYSASNGKTTIFNMFEEAFSIYVKELPKNAFTKNNPDLHKIFYIAHPIQIFFCRAHTYA